MEPRSIAIALAFCVSLVSTPFTSYAQMSKTRQQRLIVTAKRIGVTRKQAKRLYPILNAEEPKLQAIRNDPSLSRAQKLKRIWAVQDASNPQIKAILTPAQFQQLQIFRQQRRAQLIAAAKSSPHHGGAARLK